jgi:chaperonin GroES
MKNIKPVGNRILVELIKINNTTESGFILSSQEKVEQQKGKVISVGTGFGEEKELLSTIQPGNIVYFSRYGGEDIKDDKGEVVKKIIGIENVVAIEQD